MRALGIILAGGNSSRMGRLTDSRAIAAMPVAGSYRCIDFALSNMTNSSIQRVAVLTQYNARSLNEHLMSAKWWNFGRKHGGLFIFTPTETSRNASWYRGTADAISQNLDWLKQCHEPYVVIASGDGVYKLDYNEVLQYHIRKNADITLVCTDAGKEAHRFGVVTMNADGRVTDFQEKPLEAESSIVSIGVYVVRRHLLIELLEEADRENRFDFVNDILIRYRKHKKIYGYFMDSYWRNISTVESYYETNMDFLKPSVRRLFLDEYPKITSRVDDFPPAKYNRNCSVRNSLISDGCILNGTVENSVLFRDVYVGDNCIIRNSVIMNGVYIGDNSVIENCIVESRGTIAPDSRYIGENETEVIVEKNNRYEYF